MAKHRLRRRFSGYVQKIAGRNAAFGNPLYFAKDVPRWAPLPCHIPGRGLAGHTDHPPEFRGRQITILEVLFQVHGANVTIMAPSVNIDVPTLVHYAAPASVTLFVDMNRLGEIQREQGVSDNKLAILVGTTRQQIGRLRKGERKLTTEWAERIAPHLHVQPYELFIKQSDIYDFKVDEILRKVRENADSPEEAKKQLREIRETIDIVMGML